MPQESKARTILFLTNKELGQATVILAVAHEFLIRQSYAVHIASFPGLETAVFQLNAQATATYKSTSSTALTSVGYASTATFHALPGPNMTQAVTGSKPYSSWFATHEIGFFGAQRAYGPLCTFAAPWSGDDHVACFKRCVEIIKQVEPGIVVVEPLLAMGIDACRTLGVKYAMLSPNSVKDHVVQANLGNLWKYPVICSGYTYPLPWKHILPNAYLAICAGVALARSPSINAINERRHAEGIKGPYPIMSSMDENPAPVLMASREETDYPSFVPDHITRCGPILRPCGSVSEERSELAKWLAQRPTVLINLGSNVCFNSEQARKFAIGLRVLLNARPDNQALWKLKPDRATEAADWIPSALKCIMDEVTDGTGHVCCMVHHGGANSYNEAVRAGVPQIVLPVWFDTYDYASRVEYLGIGVWGSKPSAPAINGPELGKAFIRVLHSEESSTMRQKAKVIASKLHNTDIMASETVAWVGLGNIGRGMSRNIALKGPQKSPLILYNRTASKATAFAESINAEKPNSATASSSLSAVVKDSSITFICVGDDPALDQIINTLTSDSSLSLKDKIIVDCSTVHPDTSRRIHSTLTSHGASFIACPVFGAPNAADAGQMVVVPAGSPETITRISPFLEGVTSKAVLDLGPESAKDVGRASLMKVLGNTFILNTVETLAEGLVAAEKSGLGVDAYKQWVSTMFPGPFAKYAERMTTGDYFKREEPLFAVDLARKDLRHAANLAGGAGMTLPSVKVTDEFLKVVKEEKGVKGDIAGVYGAIRKGAGLPYENQ
ncbi:uncharacterized protein BDV17DRAFT_279222 [Aspergillus undulatus]|uniref:uncharacterized protein n=1 Tax=Aspergillus undulatus TaxID=1810928 RepID=UPI003CCE232D